MRPPYKAVMGVIILLMIAAPAVSLAKCVEDHFQCCGSYTAATEIGTASELSGWCCHDARAERQDAPDVHAASLFLQPIPAEAPSIAITSHRPLAEYSTLLLPAPDSQPLLCTFLI